MLYALILHKPIDGWILSLLLLSTLDIIMQQRTCKTGLGDDQYIDVELEF